MKEPLECGTWVPHKDFPLLPEETRYRVQSLEESGWTFPTARIYTLKELTQNARSWYPYRLIRAVKISWADPNAIHSILWVRKPIQ